jgi:2-amino-4-hydroxy-6-hydroxymethyldihydropteridine diphosphokinase
LVLAIVALGANLPGRFPSPADAVTAALVEIGAHVGLIVARSRLYRSVAWPDPNDPAFVNAAALVETALTAAAFLARLHDIEASFGRVRGQANAPRPLDLDLVDFGGVVSAPGDSPILPHPRVSHRAFVLLPLRDIAPDWRHPVSGLGVSELIAALAEPASAVPL